MTSQSSPEYLQAILRASSALLQSFTLKDTAATIVELSEQMLQADAHAIWYLDRSASSMRLLTARGLSDEYLRNSQVPLASNVLSLTEMVIPDVDSEPLLQHMAWRYAAEGIRSLLVFPLKDRGEDFGTLTLYYRTPHVPDENELTLGRTLTNLSAVAITAARIAEEKRDAEARLRFLNQAGVILNESLDFRLTLTNLTQAVVPEFADWCTVHLLEDGSVNQVALAHFDPERVRWAEELQERYPSNPEAPQGAHQVIRTGAAEVMPEIPFELLKAAAQDEEHLRLLDEVGFKSYICVPIRTRQEVIGALTLISAESGRSYNERDLAVAEEIGWRAGLAVEKARLFERSELARAELERSNQAKDEFLGTVSHELKNPISTIYGSARLLRRAGSSLGAEDRETLVSGIEEASTHLVQLIDSFLMLARLDVGKAVHKVELDIEDLLEGILARSDDATRVHVSFHSRARTMSADAVYLEHILSNLLGNALKYSPENEEVDIEVHDTSDGIEFGVMDRGPGVEPAEIDLIFDSFYRSPGTSHLPGKGLGLSICRRLVEAQGGRIWARLREGGGLEVRFNLPS